MENNLENKARFFAQYYGQSIQKDIELEGKYPLTISNISFEPEKCYLELKHISSITDEELFQVFKSLENEDYHMKEYGKIIKVEKLKNGEYFNLKARIFCEKKNYILSTQIFYNRQQVDILRRLGFATPWEDLSIEDQISFGWVKLKEN